MLKLINSQENIVKILFIISLPFLTLICSNGYSVTNKCISMGLSFIIGMFISKKVVNIKTLTIKKCIFLMLFTLYTGKTLLCYYDNVFPYFNSILKLAFNFVINENYFKYLVGILIIPSIFFIYDFLYNYLISYVVGFYHSLTKNEKRYLLIVIIVGTILSFGLSLITSAFSNPTFGGNTVYYDVIYTSDTGALVSNDAYSNISYAENDIRQPLFGIFALPFSVLAHLLSDLLYFLPNNISYSAIMTIIQIILVSLTVIMLSKLLKVKEKDEKYFFFIFSFSFSYLIFSFILEQYVIGYFYLMTTIYYYYSNKDSRVNYFYIPAVGTLITSGIIFPLISKEKEFLKKVKDIWKCFISFVCFSVIGGQLFQFTNAFESVRSLTTRFSGDVSIWNRICQFSHFISSIILAPLGEITRQANNYPCYHLKVFNSISFVGLAILIIALYGYFSNRKNKLARLSILWILFSIIILLIIGWGTQENGLILYDLYFAWAYLVLVYFAIKKILKRFRFTKNILIVLSLLIILNNFIELFKIVCFSIKYY